MQLQSFPILWRKGFLNGKAKEELQGTNWRELGKERKGKEIKEKQEINQLHHKWAHIDFYHIWARLLYQYNYLSTKVNA